MARDFAIKFYQSKEWIKCRTGYMQSQYYVCEVCKGPALICHHKEWLTPENITDPNITLSWDKLQSVCLDCHNRIHGNNEIIKEGLRFDEDGNLKKVPPSKVKDTKVKIPSTGVKFPPYEFLQTIGG